MIKIQKTILINIAILLSLLFAQSPALDNYIALEDTSYSYYAADTIFGDNYTKYILYLSSQTWRDTSEVDRTLWEHWVGIIVPDDMYFDKALFFIDGGSNTPDPPDDAIEELVMIATLTNSIVVEFGMVPNEPLTFSDETEPRSEDEIIAYTWDKYLNSGDETWILQLPMVKSAVRGMDMVQSYLGDLDDPIDINEFIVSGASKRGWTTWLTSAVDERVCATIPLVFDALNLVQSFRHHYGAYGFWSEAVEDYEDMGIFDWFSYPEIHDLTDIVDPLEYKDRFTMPKFLIHATGDEFFVPSSQFYFDELPGPTFQRYVPNTGHEMDSAIEDIIYSILAFYKAILFNNALPEFSWEVMEDGSIQFETITTPTQVRMWKATNENAFDFRYPILGEAWTDSILSDQGSGIYIGDVSEPDSGWSAFFIEATYLSGGQFSYKFTTDVSFLPKTLPYATDVTFTLNTNPSWYENVSIVGEMTSGLPQEMALDSTTGLWTLHIPIVIDGNYSWYIIGVANNDSITITDELLSFSVMNGQLTGQTNFDYLGVNIVNKPETFIVRNAYPNPFNPQTSIEYELLEKSEVTISIYDILGKEIFSENKNQVAGHHRFIWQGKSKNDISIASGVYLLRISNAYSDHIQKLILLK